MIFDLHREPLHRRIEARALGDGPTLHHAIDLETKIEVEVTGGVLLDYKTEAADAVGRANLFARWLPRPREIALLPILGELSARARPGVRSRFYSHAGILCGLRLFGLCRFATGRN